MADDATVILVSWRVTDKEVTTLNLEMQEGGEGQWEPVEGASGLSTPTTEFKVTDLRPDKTYRFRLDMRRPGEQHPVYVVSEVGKWRNLTFVVRVFTRCIPRERSPTTVLHGHHAACEFKKPINVRCYSNTNCQLS